MAGRKITQLPTLTTPAATDKLVIVDVSDTSESPQGTSKQIAFENLSGGITSIESDSLDVSIDGGVAKVELPYEGIPLTGTEEDKPLTGAIKVAEGINLAEWTVGNELYVIGFEDTGFVVRNLNTVTNAYNRFTFGLAGSDIMLEVSDGSGSRSSAVVSRIVEGSREALILSDKLAFFNKADSVTPATQAAAIADATDATDVITQLNTLLAAMRSYGLIAE